MIFFELKLNTQKRKEPCTESEIDTFNKNWDIRSEASMDSLRYAHRKLWLY